VKAKEADVNSRCIPGAKADEPRRSGLLLECCHTCLNHGCLNSVGISVRQPHWSTPALWNSREYFLDCLVAALEVRRTTEDDGITACFVSPQAFKTPRIMDLGKAILPFIQMNARMG
jgi:hypothetical protein